MPRKGYEVITVTKEAHLALLELKTKLNARSISEVIIKLNSLVDAFFTILSPDYVEWLRDRREQSGRPEPIRIQIRTEASG